ncbi:hypothetical protein FB446DRAFT_793851 [Lentinula raphanica]|nr:hypothetical protein FB446DRAFT_793851 [Lentinula raphanica]
MNDSSDEILSIDIHEQDVASGRIGRVVTSSANRFISVWTLTSSGEFSKVFTTTLDDNLKPKTVRMCKQTRDIFVFPLYGGEIIRLDYKMGEIKSRKSPGPGRMGSVALNRTSDKFVAYTGKNFQLYRLANFARKLGDVEDIQCGNTVGGTDRGCALVYDVESERIIQTLQYPGGNLVQPVSTFTLPGRHLIAVAGSTQEQSSDVILYEKRFPQTATQASSEVDPEPNELIDPSAHSDHSVLIGFYVPKKVWNWVWITTSLLCLCLALYLAIPDSLARIYDGVLRSEPQWNTPTDVPTGTPPDTPPDKPTYHTLPNLDFQTPYVIQTAVFIEKGSLNTPDAAQNVVQKKTYTKPKDRKGEARDKNVDFLEKRVMKVG